MPDERRRIAGVEVHFDAPAERVALGERPTQRAFPAAKPPRPAARSEPSLPPSKELSDAKAKIDGDMLGMAEYLEGLRKAQQSADAIQNKGIAIIARELGVEHRLPEELRKSLPPAPPALPAPPTLRAIAERSEEAASSGATLERRSKRSLLIEILITLITIATLLERIVEALGKK